MDETKPNPQATPAARKVIDAVAMGLVNGRPAEEIVEELTRQGWQRDDAAAFVRKIDEARQQAHQASQARASLLRSMGLHVVMGLLWVVAGVALMVTAKPGRDWSSLGVAIIAFGVFEMFWFWKNWHRMSGR